MKITLSELRRIIAEETKSLRPTPAPESNPKGGPAAPAAPRGIQDDPQMEEVVGSERTIQAIQEGLVEYFTKLGRLLQQASRSRKAQDFYKQAINLHSGTPLDKLAGSKGWDAEVTEIVEGILGSELSENLHIPSLVAAVAGRMVSRKGGGGRKMGITPQRRKKPTEKTELT